MSIDYKSIGQRLAEARKSLNLTQTQTSELLNVSKSYIANIERGKKPSLEYILAIAKNTNISLDWLLIGEQNYSQIEVDDVTKELIDIFASIPIDAKPYMLGVIKTIIQNSADPKSQTSSIYQSNDGDDEDDTSNIA